MARLFVQYLPTYNTEHLPKIIFKILQYNKSTNSEMAKNFEFFAKVTKFRQIWPHWTKKVGCSTWLDKN